MSKSVSTNTQSPSIFLQLREENHISSEKYDQLWQVMQKLGYSDFLTREQGLITLKFLKGENVFGVLPTSGGKSFTATSCPRLWLLKLTARWEGAKALGDFVGFFYSPT